jgi:lysophospholipase L1-like esterase
MTGEQVAAAPAATDQEEGIAIFLVGDSTVCDHSSSGNGYWIPKQGWGAVLQSHFSRLKAVVKNLALDGESSKRFTTTDNYKVLINTMKKGDWLFIQFGHNDEKAFDPSLYTDPVQPRETVDSFKWYLYEKYIKAARNRGAYPVLITPVSRRDGITGGACADTVAGSHYPYDWAIRNLALETGIPCIDMTAKTKILYEELSKSGKEKSTGLFAVTANGDTDNTHFNKEGAMRICALVVEGMKALRLPLITHILLGD